jgi:predicted DNA-binding ribbon-helix-helix protein
MAGYAASVTLEPEYWDALRKIAIAQGKSVEALIRQIDESLAPSRHRSLSSQIYAFVLKWFREAAAAKQRIAQSTSQRGSL